MKRILHNRGFVIKLNFMQEYIKQAIKVLSSGGLIAFPTETVYGLGADAANPDAIKKIFAAKKRPADHPLIVHLADSQQLLDWASTVSSDAARLAEAFWPGPLTLILQKKSGVSDLITGGQNTIGLRIPKHPVANALLKAFGRGVVAPSANRFGRISPTTAEAVQEELGDAVDLILEGGACEVGVESTIVDMSGEAPVILRPGMIRAEHIEAVLQRSVEVGRKDAPRVSGSHLSHYAPRTPVVLLSTTEIQNFLANRENIPAALMSLHEFTIADSSLLHVKMSKDPQKYAHDLYQVLRDLDKKKLQRIVVEAVPETSEWDAIRDRLSRASHVL